jgi:hypothetical protein
MKFGNRSSTGSVQELKNKSGWVRSERRLFDLTLLHFCRKVDLPIRRAHQVTDGLQDEA